MRADDELDRAVGEALQRLLLLRCAVAAGQQGEPHAGRLGERRDGGVVLAREDLGRRHQRGLARRPRPRSAWRGRRPASCRCRHRPAAAASCARAWPCRRRSRPTAPIWLAVKREGQGCKRTLLPPAVALGRRGPPAVRVVMRTRAMASWLGQQLVEGEAARAPDASARGRSRSPAHAARSSAARQPAISCAPGRRRPAIPAARARARPRRGDRLLDRPLASGPRSGRRPARPRDRSGSSSGTTWSGCAICPSPW